MANGTKTAAERQGASRDSWVPLAQRPISDAVRQRPFSVLLFDEIDKGGVVRLTAAESLEKAGQPGQALRRTVRQSPLPAEVVRAFLSGVRLRPPTGRLYASRRGRMLGGVTG